MRDNKNYSFWGMVLNPIVLVIYGITCFYIYSLLQYGGVRRKIPIILVGGTLLLIWSIGSFIKYRKKDFTIKNSKINRFWYFTALIILLSTTAVTGVKIYQSGVNFQGKLAWFIHDIKNKREIEFVHDNIYDHGLDGIFEDIRGDIMLPEESYLSNDFRLQFKRNGDIASIDAYLYGKEEGETQSFLISYDRDRGEDITVYLNGYVEANFDEEMKLQPLLELMQWIPLEETVNNWSEERFGIGYDGVRNWGYNTEGIVYIDENGEISKIETPEDEILGYTVSVYVPGKEEITTPVRFVHNELEGAPREDEKPQEQWDIGYNHNDGEETFFLNEDLGYQLSVVDAALGSRFYSLLQTQDSGDTWETINLDPYLNNTGVSSGITFINEELGFIGLSHNGGDHAELYRTDDGGISFEEISIPEVEVSLNESETYNPFDFPEMPYEENEKLNLLVHQGADGDYQGGIQALYQSKDHGQTWTYVKEVESNYY